MKLQYESIPAKWEQGLPLGNGRLAAMVWGEKTDIISLNHEWIWTGNYKVRKNQKTANFLPMVRAYLDEGDYFRANALAAVAFGGNGGISPLERRMDSFQPAGELQVSYKGVLKKAVRGLDLRQGYATCEKTYTNNKVCLTAWCDVVKDVVCLKYTAEAPIDFAMEYIREAQKGASTQTAYTAGGFRFDCHMGEGVSFCAMGQIATDGVVSATQAGITVQQATAVTIFMNIGTQHAGIEAELAQTSLKALRSTALFPQHCAAFAEEMDRCEISVSAAQPQPEFLDTHIAHCKEQGVKDAVLVTAYTRFAQYLMVAGTLRGQLPMHLQGKWNKELAPKWNSDYHLNVNLQMNYWAAHAMDLSIQCKKMLEYVKVLLPQAKQAAQDLYGCKGVLYPLNSDIWGNCTAEAYNYSVWVGAAGWLCRHFMDYYDYTQDRNMLATEIYPFVREVVAFYEDYFTFAPDGTVQIQPSQSPENKFAGGGYFPVSICTNAAMDVQIAYETLESAMQCARILETDAEDAARWEALLLHFPPFAIGDDGRLLEWDTQDKKELELGHRHVSHLYGVYPAQLFGPSKRVAQFAAARKSLEYRLQHSGAHTGWSCAWAACLFARFLDGDAVQENLHNLICNLSSVSLLDLHPNYYPATETENRADTPALFTQPEKNPPMIFQIDGNLGAAAAVCEALVQVREGEIHLLCAKAPLWRQGYVRGMVLTGGHKISFAWQENTLTQLVLVLGAQGRAVFAPLGQVTMPQKGVTQAASGALHLEGVAGKCFVLLGEAL